MIKIRNCAIYGGTFDPIHNGHIHLIDWLISSSRFDQVVIVPAGSPWQRKPVAGANDRLEMARLALHGRNLIVSESEVRRGGASFAIDTVREIAAEIPAQRYTWIIGSDAFAGISTWHEIDALAKLVEFLVIARPGHNLAAIPSGIQFESVEVSALDISATQIRHEIATGGTWKNLVAPEVAEYIERKRIYAAA